MAKWRVLYVCHNHPSVRPGGGEVYALELYEGMRDSAEFEPMFLAKGGPPLSNVRQPHLGTVFGLVNDDPNQYFLYNDGADFDWCFGTSRNKVLYTKFFHEFLVAYQPDIVHFQHTVFLGYDIIRQTKNTLPKSRIVYTLHEFLPICHNNGQMIRTRNHELCSEESPRRCHECFPQMSPQTFFMRKRFIQSQLSLVDLFVAPSRFLLERYVEWGIHREKIRFEPNGRRPVQPIADDENDRPRNRLGFFGQFSVFKGVNVLLKAIRVLGRERADARSNLLTRRLWQSAHGVGVADGKVIPDATNDAHLWLYGANLEIQPGTFQNEFNALLRETHENVTLVGSYDPSELPKLMASVDWVVVPSIWWENAPLVIQEAFQYGRPVICSNIGGMAEHVTDGVDGLHFRVGDPQSLAQTIRHAIDTPGLWQKLRSGISPVHSMADHVAALADIYRSLLTQTAVWG